MGSEAQPASVGDQLVQAAVVEVAEVGVGRVSLRAIARRVGVSHQAATHHFQDRAGLFTAVAVEGYSQLRRAIAEAREAVIGSSTERVIAGGIAYVEFADTHHAYFDIMFRPEVLHAQDPDLVEEQLATWMALVAGVQEAQAEGWGADSSPEVLAAACWSAVHGVAMLQKSSPLIALTGGMEIGEIVRMMTATIAQIR